MDFSNFLTLYSGGVDSTVLIHENPSAQTLLHYRGLNELQTKVAWSNALALDRKIDILSIGEHPTRDGEVSPFHSLMDAQMILDACTRAVTYGKSGIVLGFTGDDFGTDFKAIQSIVRKVDPKFEIALPLIERSAAEVRKIAASIELPTVSCLIDKDCGQCPKCRRGY